jgi:hypothetical protein
LGRTIFAIAAQLIGKTGLLPAKGELWEVVVPDCAEVNCARWYGSSIRRWSGDSFPATDYVFGLDAANGDELDMSARADAEHILAVA